MWYRVKLKGEIFYLYVWEDDFFFFKGGSELYNFSKYEYIFFFGKRMIIYMYKFNIRNFFKNFWWFFVVCGIDFNFLIE